MSVLESEWQEGAAELQLKLEKHREGAVTRCCVGRKIIIFGLQ